MNNILTYLDWRGDITFAEREFNTVDNLIICEMAYIDFAGIIPNISESNSHNITIRDAYEKIIFRDGKVTVSKGRNRSGEYTSFLEKLALSDRFGSAKLSRFIDIYDNTRYLQFAAMCIELGDNTTYIVFRGTDQTLIGWREDFAMSFQSIPAQQEAASYFEKIAQPNNTYRIGGHSKGGHLAVYAAMMCHDKLKTQIVAIYNNDGPGLSAEIINREKFAQIKSKIELIIPEFCVIGMLFENDIEKQIVKSHARGISQHDSMSWMVARDLFVSAEDIHPNCKIINAAIDEWLESTDITERKAFVNHFFDSLAAGGAKYISDIPTQGIGSFGSVFRALVRMEADAKAASGKLATTLRKGIRERMQGLY